MVFVSNYVNSCMKFLLNIHEMAALNVSDKYVTNLIQRAACHAVAVVNVVARQQNRLIPKPQKCIFRVVTFYK